MFTAQADLLGFISTFAPKAGRAPTQITRRRTTPMQGRALEILGHAVEYLADSRLYEALELPSDGAAIRTLMLCSRQVFAECELIEPWHQRAKAMLVRRLHIQPAA